LFDALCSWPASVAAQQGKYLARRLNAFAKQQKTIFNSEQANGRMPVQLNAAQPGALAASRPFRYRHTGSLAYFGGESAGLDFGSAGQYTGFIAFLLWKGVYLSQAVSTRTRMALVYDWFASYVFGRNTAR
jgi:NADH dehydrogenase FAD-containing subunit